MDGWIPIVYISRLGFASTGSEKEYTANPNVSHCAFFVCVYFINHIAHIKPGFFPHNIVSFLSIQAVFGS